MGSRAFDELEGPQAARFGRPWGNLSPMKWTLRLLLWLFPLRWLLLALLALTATGTALHRMERFAGLTWGLTELAHVWIGWASTLLWTGYVTHHVAKRWGPWGTRQRILGLLLTAASLALLVTGALLGLGLRGGPPDWALPLHWWGTWAMAGLLIWHASVAWMRWPRRAWRRIVDGPRVPLSARSAGPEEAANPSP